MKQTTLLTWLRLAVWTTLSATALAAVEATPKIVIHNFSGQKDYGVIKWDCPCLVIYGDSSAIWRKNWAKSIDAFRTVSAIEVEAIARRILGVVERYNGRTFVLSASNHPPLTTIWASGLRLHIEGNWRAPSIWTADDPDPEYRESIKARNAREQRLWALLPDDIRQMLSAALSFEHDAERPWSPEQAVVDLQLPRQADEGSIPWPAHWPREFATDPYSARSLTIALPGSMLHELLSVVPDDGRPKAVLLNGSSRYASIRFVLPGQREWLEN
jgi:hypothetical protein